MSSVSTGPKFKNILVSVSDKTGLTEFLQPFAAQGARVVSTGGTAAHLRAAGLTVVDVTSQTGFPEVMGGRVKTLHPHIHMGLLARAENFEDQELLRQRDLVPFDLVVVNLYPFEQGLQKGLAQPELVELIDVGGPSMLRAAAKNYASVTVVCDPVDYQWLSQTPEAPTADQRLALAAKAFARLASYDAVIADFLESSAARAAGSLPAPLFWAVGGRRVQTLRYGENPQQSAFWTQRSGRLWGLHQAEQLQGKELSYNNILDIDAAIRTLREFPESPTVVAVKHNNPCGVAMSDLPLSALEKGLQADPVSVFGGIVAMNFRVGRDHAEILRQLFLECIIAPEIAPEAMDVLKAKANLRVLGWPEMLQPEIPPDVELRSVLGGLLAQSSDPVGCLVREKCRVHGTAPTPAIWEEIDFVWRVAARLKSNAIAITSRKQTVGLGMGQVNRVDAVEQAIQRLRKFHPQAPHPVLASDGFFPFPDSIERIAEAGIKWIVQPGGSISDAQVLARAQELGVTMVLTHQRHFLH